MNDSKEIRNRIQKATGAFAKMKETLQNRNIPAKLRNKTYEATVLNILLFGCESWALKEQDRKNLKHATTNSYEQYSRYQCSM